MYGFWYSVKENYNFSTQELKELFFTSLAFAFMLTSFYTGLFIINADVRLSITDSALAFFILSLLVVFFAMYIHVALQKLVGIKLGYKVKYSYWLNGILLGLFLSVMTLGKVPVLSLFILPGAVTLEHLPKLRLGKFRYGMNAKDIARISLAGPLAHIIITLVLGVVYFNTGKNPIVFHLITANLLLLIYSMLPVPKLDIPTKIDSASDGLGIFFFSRKIYVLCAVIVLFYAIMIWVATSFSFVIAFTLGLLTTLIYSIVVKQPN
jgi:ABC-type proline/glycine betaine transport system permease subunit